MSTTPRQVIIVGGALAGLSVAHAVLEKGEGEMKMMLLDKQPSLGGNSVKASSGINGCPTAAQKAAGIQDSVSSFAEDTLASATPSLANTSLIHILASHSAQSLSWLTTRFPSIDLSVVGHVGGHSVPRTHRGKGGAPGWAITSALIKRLEEEEGKGRVKVVKGAKVVAILPDAEGKSVAGVEYEKEGGRVKVEGVVVVASGGYGADFSPTGLLAQNRPDLLSLPTSNGPHSTGDLHILLSAPTLPPSLRASLIHLNQVQVHPTGFTDPSNPKSKTKFLAAEALRGAGGLLVDGSGKRFVDEMSRRDWITAKMGEILGGEKGPVRLLLNQEAVDRIGEHCSYYVAKGLMKQYDSARAFVVEASIPFDNLEATFKEYEAAANGEIKDVFGKVAFQPGAYTVDSPLHVALITPLIHYTMGGLEIDTRARVISTEGTFIPNLFAAGEVTGGIHGANRLGGSSLLECVVFGRVAGEEAVKAALTP